MEGSHINLIRNKGLLGCLWARDPGRGGGATVKVDYRQRC